MESQEQGHTSWVFQVVEVFPGGREGGTERRALSPEDNWEEVLTDAASPLAQIMSTMNEAAHQLSRSGTSLYAVLELKKGASPGDIKKSYRC
nr:dnaJ homolog subfamily C member 5G isoform X3 [Symphalangus syndactylus]